MQRTHIDNTHPSDGRIQEAVRATVSILPPSGDQREALTDGGQRIHGSPTSFI